MTRWLTFVALTLSACGGGEGERYLMTASVPCPLGGGTVDTWCAASGACELRAPDGAVFACNAREDPTACPKAAEKAVATCGTRPDGGNWTGGGAGGDTASVGSPDDQAQGLSVRSFGLYYRPGSLAVPEWTANLSFSNVGTSPQPILSDMRVQNADGLVWAATEAPPFLGEHPRCPTSAGGAPVELAPGATLRCEIGFLAAAEPAPVALFLGDTRVPLRTPQVAPEPRFDVCQVNSPACDECLSAMCSIPQLGCPLSCFCSPCEGTCADLSAYARGFYRCAARFCKTPAAAAAEAGSSMKTRLSLALAVFSRAHRASRYVRPCRVRGATASIRLAPVRATDSQNALASGSSSSVRQSCNKTRQSLSRSA